jgi:hypothetical protein
MELTSKSKRISSQMNAESDIQSALNVRAFEPTY